MSYPSYKSNENKAALIAPHGGYRRLLSYQMAEVVFDLDVIFCNKYIPKTSRTHDQMVQAGRSGKQNIAEGSMVSGTSKKLELKLIGVARASFEELLQDFLDFLRQHNLPMWDKNDPRVKKIRALSYITIKSSRTYLPYMSNPESAANCLICLLHQTNFLLDRQLRRLERDFLEHGGFTEKLYKERRNQRGY